MLDVIYKYIKRRKFRYRYGYKRNVPWDPAAPTLYSQTLEDWVRKYEWATPLWIYESDQTLSRMNLGATKPWPLDVRHIEILKEKMRLSSSRKWQRSREDHTFRQQIWQSSVLFCKSYNSSKAIGTRWKCSEKSMEKLTSKPKKTEEWQSIQGGAKPTESFGDGTKCIQELLSLVWLRAKWLQWTESP